MEHQLDLFDALYEDFKFDTNKPLRVVELFSGIGFQSMGMDLAEIPFLVVGTSEIDKFSVKSYAAIHTDYLELRDTYEFPDKEVMVEYLQEKNIGWNFSSNKHSITMSTNEETVKDFYLATILNNNLGDITKVKGSDLEKDIDLFTYSFPCQSLSKAGSGGGLSVETKSGLVYEVLRILHELKEENNLPKVLIMENVVDLVQVNYVDEWNRIALEMESEFSYKHYLQILNAKDYGIAQNRQRVFMVSILGDYNYNFPKGFELEYRLKDYLEDEVDDKYYLSDAMYDYLTSEHEKFSRKEVFERNIKGREDDIAATITTRETNVPTSTFIDMDLVESEEPTIIAQRGRYTENGIEQQFEVGSSDTSNALTTVQKDNYLLIPEATTRGYKEAYEGDGVYINRAHQKRGVVQDGMIQTLKTSGNDVGVVVGAYDYKSSENYMKGKNRLRVDAGVAGTIITHPREGVALKESNNLRIRKLTPRETGRLMGMQDYQINKQAEVTSNAQMYKQHGNGIVAQVIGLIIGMAYYEDENELREKVMTNSHMWIKEKEK